MYWCEGTKAKPWRVGSGEQIAFTNSDSGLILLFLSFLRAMGVADGQLRFRVAIHETADAADAVRWWAKLVGVAPESFQRTTIKRHSPKTVRHNTGSDYRGCLIITVLKSREVYWAVEGIVSEMVRQAISGAYRFASPSPLG
jgi:hypothetical protein